MKTGEIEQLKTTIEHLNARLNAAEMGLSKSENRIRTLIECLPVGLMISSEGGIVEAANPQCLLMFRCDYGELVGRHLSEIFSVPPTHTQLFSNESLNAGTADSCEVTALRKDHPFPAEILLRPFPFMPASKVLVVFEDMTVKHDLDRMKREFVQMVSHDLRTPITSIRCFLNSLSEGLFDDRHEKMHQKAVAMENETTRLLTMINNLLDLDKIEAGSLAIIPDRVTLSSILKRSVEAISALAETRGVELEVKQPGENVIVQADSDLITQVIVNLLSNAIKFSAPGKGVCITTIEDAVYVKVLVSDSGPGIPEEFRQRMFNRFEQARLSDSRLKGGTGLGLAISKAIVERHGGKIGVDSEEGSGSTFWFTLQSAES